MKDVFDHMRHPTGLFRSIPLPGADKYAHPLIAFPVNYLPHERPNGAFGPRCSFFEAGKCDVGEKRMKDTGTAGAHFSQCERVAEIDWGAPVKHEGVVEAVPGETILSVNSLKKYYEVARTRCSAAARPAL